MSDASTAVSASPALSVARRTVNPWLVAAAVVVPTFMEVLDTTIANVALRYIAGGLSAAVTDSEWVVTSYLAGGGLQPSSQAVLLDSFPPRQQGAAQTVFGVAALLAPVIGPTLGGWLTDNYSWRWIFYINLPAGTVAFLASYFLLSDPDYLQKARAELRKRPLQFDAIGLGLLVITMVCWEVILSKGQEWDWLGDPSGCSACCATREAAWAPHWAKPSRSGASSSMRCAWENTLIHSTRR